MYLSNRKMPTIKKRTRSKHNDPLRAKEKSNDSKYLKYRQKHTVKGVVDFEWKRLNLGLNVTWKSKMLAVDYLMVDEREKDQPDVMEYIRQFLYGNIGGETLNSYWKEKNTDYCVVDLRAGVKITKDILFQFSVNNLFNKEYCTRPMLVCAPRTYVMQLNMSF